MIVVVILPIVVGGIAVALISVLDFEADERSIGDSNDELVSSSTFNKDVQSAQQIETVTTPACGSTGQQLVGLEWDQNTTTTTYETVVSYVQTTTNGTTSLFRNVCTSGASATPTSFSRDRARCRQSHRRSQPDRIQLQDQPGLDNDPRSLWSDPQRRRPWKRIHLRSQRSSECGLVDRFRDTDRTEPKLPGCNLANPGTGTYARILCFADFSSFLSTFTSPSATCTPMKFAIANSPDLLRFCLSVTPNNLFPNGVTVEPQGLPTYDNVSQGGNSEPYLGVNGFYQGVLGEPAISQRPQPYDGCNPCTFNGANAALTTLTFTGIEVTNANNEPATGWTLVTGDAESTDTGEWNVYSNTTSPAVNWQILPNSATSLYGNTCYDTADSAGNGLFVYNGTIPPTDTTVGDPTVGLSTHDTALSITATPPYSPIPTNAASVGCEANGQLDKTGTLMLAAPEPSGSSAPQNLSITMQAGGYQAIFLGVLL